MGDERDWGSHELKNPFGLRLTDERLVLALHVPRGHECGCICPGCRTPFISKQGDKTAWHFAHAVTNDATLRCDNSGGYETAMHLAAKQAIADAGCIRLPPMIAEYRNRRRLLEPGIAKILRFERVELEQWMDGIRPDIIGFVRDDEGRQHKLLIEVYVRNPCSYEKLKLLHTRRQPAIELNLSVAYFGDDEGNSILRRARAGFEREWINYVVNLAPRSWLFHPRLEEVIRPWRDSFYEQETRDYLVRRLTWFTAPGDRRPTWE